MNRTTPKAENPAASDITESNSRNPREVYLYTVGSVLLAAATVLFLTNLHGYPVDFVPVRDPVLNLPLPSMFWVLGSVLLVVALDCLFGTDPTRRLGLVAWVSSTAVLSQMALPFMGVKGGVRGYIGPISDAFAVSPGALAGLTFWASVALLASSCAVVLLDLLRGRKGSADRGLKTVCAACGGHIGFSEENVGVQIPCPHCQAKVTLRREEALKVSCFFCQGHIEFPVHALGVRMPCPHCRQDITLKEPA